MAVYDGYEPVIGLEVHAQLQTNSKIFCPCPVEYGAPPNTRTCPICLGLPGALPVLNERAIDLAVRTILAVGGTVNERSVFARKNYFYPDLPKGYQISQFDQPVGTGGRVSFSLTDHTTRSVRLARIHLEEDAGKLVHPEGDSAESKVDLNRCGTPLIEVVTCPDIHSPEEAYAYLVKLKQILQYLDVCSGDMEKGHLRCDANVSVRPEGAEDFGTRTELKNLNSFKMVERGLRYEIHRQIARLKSHREVEQETLQWNDITGQAEVMRGKEESDDYRYFPEPDLLNLRIDEARVARVRAGLPELADQKAARLVKDYNIREYDAAVLTSEKELAEFFEQVMNDYRDGQAAANWIMTEVLGGLKESGETIGSFKVAPSHIADLLGRVDSGEISGKMAKQVFADMKQSGRAPGDVIRARGMVMISDEAALEPIIDDVLADNEENVEAYMAGKTRLFGFFIGQVMKATRGQANPETVDRLLKRKLEGEKHE